MMQTVYTVTAIDPMKHGWRDVIQMRPDPAIADSGGLDCVRIEQGNGLRVGDRVRVRLECIARGSGGVA